MTTLLFVLLLVAAVAAVQLLGWHRRRRGWQRRQARVAELTQLFHENSALARDAVRISGGEQDIAVILTPRVNELLDRTLAAVLDRAYWLTGDEDIAEQVVTRTYVAFLDGVSDPDFPSGHNFRDPMGWLLETADEIARELAPERSVVRKRHEGQFESRLRMQLLRRLQTA